MYTGWPERFMMTAMINKLKKINRTLLEMTLGIIFLGLAAQVIGAFFVQDEMLYAKSLWFGILLALAATVHMYRSLDRALDQPEKTASKMIFRAYIFRYSMVIVFMVIIMITRVMNPLVVFFAYMTLKVTAFLQPLTHKLCNKMFHETDPVPHALEEDNTESGAQPQEAGEVQTGEGVTEQTNK